MKRSLVLESGERLRLGAGRLVSEYRNGPAPPPAARTFVVAPDVVSGGEGTIGAPWSMAHALTQVVPGDTIQMRGGRWRSESGFILTNSGTEEHPITITRYPTETPVIDGALVGPVEDPTGSWEVFDAARSIYRSTFVVPKSGVEWGGFIALGVDPDDHDNWHTLIPYKTYSYLAADDHLYSSSSPYYLGPGLFHDEVERRLFVRLVNSTPESQRNRIVTQIPDPDPRQNVLHLSRSRFYAFNVHGDYNHVSDVGTIQSFYGCYQLVDTPDSPNVGFEAHDNEGHPHYFILRANHGHRWKVLGGSYDGHVDMETHWVSWVDYKEGVLAAQWMRKAAFDLGISEAFEIGPSPGTGNTVWFPTPDGAEPIVVRGFFDGILGNGHGNAEELATVHGVHFDRIFDDAWQRIAPVYRTEMYDFLCEGAGPSRDGAGASNPNTMPGTNFIHHGRIISKRAFWYRNGHPKDATAAVGWRETIALSAHSTPGVGEYTVPLKMWNMDIIVGVSGVPRATPYSGIFGRYGGVVATAEASDERYNNILYYADHRSLGRDSWTYTGDEIYDGNLYWQWIATEKTWALFHTLEGDAIVRSAADIRSAAATDSQAYYAPGWEASGVDMDPEFDVDWNPQAAIHVGALDIEALHPTWPHATGYVPHRGAAAA